MKKKCFLWVICISIIFGIVGCKTTEEGMEENIEKNEYAIKDRNDDSVLDETVKETDSNEGHQLSDDKSVDTNEAISSKAESKDEKKNTSATPDSSAKGTQSEQKPESSPSSKEPEKSGTEGDFTKPIVSETKPAVSYKPVDGTNEKEVVTLVDTVKEITEGNKVPYKYGITKQEVVSTYYNVYSDGSKTLSDTMIYTVYDASGYHATDAELQPESDQNASSYQSYYQEVLRLVNQVRADAGVEPVVLDSTLCRAASMRAVEMDYADAFSHTRPNGTKCFTVLSYYQIGYGAAGENIGYGYGSPSSVVNGWKNSQGHYENLVNPRFRKMGVGYSNVRITSDGNLWAQLFTD